MTSNPPETDAIVRKAWEEIYDGNSASLEQTTNEFVEGYLDDMYVADEREISDITEDVRDVCTYCELAASGLDEWAPADLATLSNEVFKWIAVMRKFLDVGAELSQGMTRAKAAFLLKGVSKTDSSPFAIGCCSS